MSQIHQVASVETGESTGVGRSDARVFLGSCALCTLGGLAVLAGLAQTLVWLWGPAV